MIRNYQGRADLQLYINGARKDQTMTYTRHKTWDDASVSFSGMMKNGTHSIWMQSPIKDTWGCGPDWGDLDVVVLPIVNGVAVFQTPDARKGCPAKAKKNSKLIEKVFTAKVDSVVMITGHMSRIVQGNSELQLYVDGAKQDTARRFTSLRQGADASVFFVGSISKGKHSIWLQSPDEDIWGGEAEFGDLDVVLLPTRMHEAKFGRKVLSLHDQAKCASCDSKFYKQTDQDDNAACLACGTCSVGQYMYSRCSKSTNTVCAACTPVANGLQNGTLKCTNAKNSAIDKCAPGYTLGNDKSKCTETPCAKGSTVSLSFNVTTDKVVLPNQMNSGATSTLDCKGDWHQGYRGVITVECKLGQLTVSRSKKPTCKQYNVSPFGFST